MTTWRSSAVELGKAFRNRSVKVADVVTSLWLHHDQVEPSVKSYLTTFQSETMARRFGF